MSVIYGVNPILEQMLADPGRLELIHLQRGPLKGQLGRIVRQARELNIRVVFVDRKSLNRLSGGGVHQGAVARISEYEYADLNSILTSLKSPARIVVLDGVQDPHNLGAIVRTGVCAGIDGVVMPDRNAASMTAVAIKASAGAATLARVVKVGNLVRTLEEFKQHNVWTVAVESGGESTIAALDPTLNYAFVFGSEGKGIRRLVRERCDRTARIPMAGDFNSLNVSVAVGVVLFSLPCK